MNRNKQEKMTKIAEVTEWVRQIPQHLVSFICKPAAAHLCFSKNKQVSTEQNKMSAFILSWQ